MSDWFGDIGNALSGAGDWLGRNASWLLPVAGTVGSTLFASNANQNAANAAAAGNQNALNQMRYMYDQTRADQTPYREAGYAALGQMVPQVAGGFQASPGYQFSFNEGLRALNNSAAGRGLADSGALARSAIRYGQGAASQEYGNYWNRLASMAGLGQTANNTQSAANQQFGTSAGGIMQNTGQVNANALTAQGNNVMSGVNNLLRYFAT